MAGLDFDHLFETDQNGSGAQSEERSVFIQFVDTNGEETGTPVFVPCSSSVVTLTDILTALREKVNAFSSLCMRVLKELDVFRVFLGFQ